MKKIFSLLIMLTLIIIPSVNAEDLPEAGKDKVTVYMFRGNGCGACSDAIAQINELEGKYDDYFELVTYETWYNQNNQSLLNYFVELYQAQAAVPFFIVGDDYHQVGFSESVYDAALAAYEDEGYTDIVAEYISGEEHNYTPTNLAEAVAEEGMEYLGTEKTVEDKSANNYEGLIVVGILVVVIAGLGLLIFVPRKNGVQK